MAGLPAVQKIKREELKAKHPEMVESKPVERVMIPADISAAPINEGGDPQPPPELPPEEVPVEKPLSVDEQWRIKFEQQEQRLRSRDQERVNAENKAREEIEGLKKLVEDLRSTIPPPKIEPDLSEELTPEEIATYGSSQAFVDKVSTKVARKELKKALDKIDALSNKLEQLEQATTRVETGVASSEEDRFVDSVKRNIKNFDVIIASTEWLDYLKQKVPYSRLTISNMLDKAHNDRDLDSIVEIFEGFKPNRAALARMTSPALNGGAAPVNTNGQQKPMLKWSDRKRISEDFRKGRLNKTDKDKWDVMFKEAEAENRIDYDK